MRRWWFAVIVGGLFSLLFTVQPFRDPDVWWHLAMGRYITAHGFPSREPFSFLTPAHPWVSQQWLYEVGLWKITSTLGAPVVSLLMGLICSCAFILAAASQPRLGKAAAIPTFLSIVLASLVCGQIVGVRGQVFSLAGIGLVLLIIKRWRQGSRRILWLLPPVFCLWANLHAGFIAGLLLLLGAAIFVSEVEFQQRRRLLLWLGASLAATLLNPWGLGLWQYIAEYPSFGIPSIEWLSPDFHNLWLRVFELSVFLLVVLWITGKKPRFFEVAIATAALVASLQAQRNVSLFAIIALPQIAQHGRETWQLHFAGKMWPGLNARWRPVGLGVSAGIAIGACAFLVSSLQSGTATKFVASTYPQAAVSYVLNNFPQQRVYTLDTWGGYLAYRDPGDRVVFLYDEITIFGHANIDAFQAIHLVKPNFANVLSDNQIKVAIVGKDSQEVSELATIGWSELCQDSQSGTVVMAASAAPQHAVSC